MKILFSQKINGISGSELYLLQILPELKRRGHEVEMLLIFPTFTTRNEVFKATLEQNGVVCHEIYGYSTFSRKLITRIAKLVKTGKYDLVQSNLVHADLWFALVKMFFHKNMKLISVKHGYSEGYSAKYGYDISHVKKDPFYWIQKFACRMADYSMAISKGLYHVYVDSGIIDASRIKVVYYGLTLQLPQQETSAPDATDRYALIIGRLVGFKGHKYLIEAWKKVHEADPSLKLYIAGDGALRSELTSLVEREGLQHAINFCGHVPNPHPLIQNSLFTIVSSTWEGFGLVLLESWQHKKPIVAFDVPAMNEVIDDGVNGLLAEKENSDDLAKKIIALAGKPEQIVAFGQKGFEKLNSYYTLKRMTDEVEAVYAAVIQGKQPA